MVSKLVRQMALTVARVVAVGIVAYICYDPRESYALLHTFSTWLAHSWLIQTWVGAWVIALGCWLLSRCVEPVDSDLANEIEAWARSLPWLIERTHNGLRCGFRALAKLTPANPTEKATVDAPGWEDGDDG